MQANRAAASSVIPKTGTSSGIKSTGRMKYATVPAIRNFFLSGVPLSVSTYRKMYRLYLIDLNNPIPKVYDCKYTKIICIFFIFASMETPQLNTHNKQEFEPAHTAEHILNATMVKMFGCPRSRNAHVEKKKSKCDYILDAEPTAEQVAAIEAKVNEVISSNLDVTIDFIAKEEAAAIVDLSKLPRDASETLRLVKIGDYDICACIGAHVKNTSEVGTFKIISHSYENGIWRLRWKVII